MDSTTRIDYALFQLTPTRTRCDLVVFCGGQKEKVASGLLEPFMSHLKSAKEQISKGGYSITLRAPTADASWFIKGTLERFVRFVSTPEVLERFVTIEREILQIECSVQSNEVSDPTIAEEAADGISKKSIVPFKPKGESDGNGDAVHEENSKHRLQRVLEARKAVLRREQAMAYARAFAAGFEMDHIDDLIFFSDAFGASRLREACINFKELCNKKHNDGLWMDELAAMEACRQQELPYFGTSGIMLTSENSSSTQSIMQNFQNGLSKVQLEQNGSPDASMSESITSHASSDANQGQMPPINTKAQLPMQWPNQLPPFMYNFQGPGMAQMPPYQGYPFPGMQVVPPYYQGNMQWPPNPEEYGEVKRMDNHRNHKSSRKKEKSSNGRESEISEQDGRTDPSDSVSGSDSDAYLQNDTKNSSKEKPHKSNGKKSSRMVVIRNINYITSDRRDGEDGASDDSSTSEDEFIDGDSLKQKVEDAVGTLTKHHKSTPHHFKKKGKNKKPSCGNESNDLVDQDLENDKAATINGSKTNENWDAFQSLLMRDDDTGPHETDKQNSLDVRDEYFTIHGSKIELRKKMVANDSFIVTGRDAGDEGSKRLESFESNEKFHPSMKKREDPSEELLFSRRMEGGGAGSQDPLSNFATELPVHKTQKGEDWFIINQPEKSDVLNATNDSSIFNSGQMLGLDGDYFHTEKTKKDALGDDSFMINSQPVAQDQFDSQWKTDISVITDLSRHENGTSSLPGNKLKVSGTCEPDDLCMVLERESGVEPAGASWSHEIDYGLDLSVAEADRKHSGADADGTVDDSFEIKNKKKNGDSETKLSGKELRSKTMRGSPGKNKQEVISRTRKPSTVSRPAVHKSKLEKEQDARKRMEELVIQRQKRIAERSAASGHTSATSRRASAESKTAISSVKDDKKMKQSPAQETKRLSLHKPGITSATIERLSSVQVKHKGPSTPSKSTQPTKTTPKVNGVPAATSSPNTAKNENKKSNTNQGKPPQQQNGTLSPLSDVMEKDRQSNETVAKLEIKPNARADALDTTEGKELIEGSPRIMKTEYNKISEVGNFANVNGGKDPIVQQESSISPQIESRMMENDNRELSKSTLVLHEQKAAHQPSQIKESIVAENLETIPKKDQDFTVVNQEEDICETNQTFAISAKISESEITPDAIESTPPPTSGLSLDQIHTRKKWISNDSLPPATKGIKKLLMFGRKKPQVSA